MNRLLAALFLGINAVLLLGCSYSFSVSTIAQHNDTAPISETEIMRAATVVSELAREFGLKPSTQLARYQQVGMENGHRVLAVYAREADRETSWSRILAVAYVDESGQFIVLVRDWDSVGPTRFTALLKERLVADLGRILPTFKIAVRRLHDMPAFYVP
jgi:hypothetical protein